MKSYIAPLLALVLVVSLTVAAGASPFPDVPAYHWAYDAVKVVADLEIYEGYPDGEFKGDDPLSRYESALVVARLLTVVDAKIQSEIEAAGLGASDDVLREVVTKIIEKEGALTGEQAEQKFEDFLKAVSALRDEFKAELAILAPKLDALSSLVATNAADIADLKDEVAANKSAIKELDRRVSEWTGDAPGGSPIASTVAELKSEIEALKAGAEEEAAKVQAAAVEQAKAVAEEEAAKAQAAAVEQAKVVALEETDAALEKRLGLLRMRVDAAEDAIDQLKGELLGLSEWADGADAKMASLTAKTAALEEADAAFERRLGLLRMRTDATEDAILELQNEVQALSQQSAAAGTKIAGMESSIADLGVSVSALQEADAAFERRLGLLRMRTDANEDAVLDLRSDLDDHVQSSESEMEQLRTRLTDVEGRLTKLNQSVALAALIAIVAVGATR